MSFSIENFTATFIEKPQTKPRETLGFELTKPMDTFSFNPPIKRSEEGEWPLAMTAFQATNSVLNIKDENKGFSTSPAGHWSSGWGAETFGILQKYLELRHIDDDELQVEEKRKRGN